ncbi:hypothetical protein F8N49_17960 [Pseudomonas sp. GXM4]|nr:hypothetical protein F8N49_17960 [Pseudomonas sp. GXM4]
MVAVRRALSGAPVSLIPAGLLTCAQLPPFIIGHQTANSSRPPADIQLPFSWPNGELFCSSPAFIRPCNNATRQPQDLESATS